MTLAEAREKISSVAEQVREDIYREEGYRPRWQWLDERRLRLYDRCDTPLMTFHVDTLQ